MLEEIAGLGFSHAELSHGIRLSLVPGILRAVDAGVIRISSVHNFCPLPAGVMGAAPNLYEPSAPRVGEREMWLRHTRKTLEFARRVGAPLMVLHSGSIRGWWRNPEPQLEAARDALDPVDSEAEAPAVGDQNLPERLQDIGHGAEHTPVEDVGAGEPVSNALDDAAYQKRLQKTLMRLRKRQQRFREHLLESYGLLVPLLQEFGVRAALENREGVVELPLDEDWPDLLEAIGHPEWFGYWHDAGHAQLKERLGLTTQQALLSDNAARHFGFHLHDVSVDARDHQPPGTGVIDWPGLCSFMRPRHTCVLELSPRLRSRQVAASKVFIEAQMAEAFARLSVSAGT